VDALLKAKTSELQRVTFRLQSEAVHFRSKTSQSIPSDAGGHTRTKQPSKYISSLLRRICHHHLRCEFRGVALVTSQAARSPSLWLVRDPQQNDVMLASHEVLRPILALQELPLAQAAWMEGLAYRTWLAETTGLSKGLVYRGGLSTLRPSTLGEAREHARQRAREQAQKGGWSDTEFLATEQRFLALDAQGGAGWAVFAASNDVPRAPALRVSVDLALKFDIDLEALRCVFQRSWTPVAG
jgi:hypothetical protein